MARTRPWYAGPLIGVRLMKSLVLGLGLVGAFALALVGQGEHAQADTPAPAADALKKAQSAFDQAQVDYLGGKYDEAAKGFQDAYAARAFPQFLYNVGASYHMKGKRTSEPEAYEKAVEFYKKYLAEDPEAADKAKVEKAIGVLEAEIKRIKDAKAQAGANAGSGSAASAQTPSQEVQQLGDVKVRGLVVIDCEIKQATIYLDDKKKGAFGTTPWSGSLEGEHKIIIEKRGYKPVETTISADPTKLVSFYASMAQAQYLGWVDISSNIPKSDVFIDDKSVGAVGQTPWSQNIKPGKHTFWVTAEGYNEYTTTIEIAAGETPEVKATLVGSPVGKLEVGGLGIEDSTIYLDGKVLCERGPCIKGVAQGEHTVDVKRSGFKPYSRTVTIRAKAHTKVKVFFEPTPSRSDAIVAYVLTAGFAGAGAFLGSQSTKLHDDIKKDIAAGMPPPDTNDPRLTKGKIYAITADSAFAIAGITAITAIYYTFREKGAPTTALIDISAVAIRPELSPSYAGMGMEVHW